MRPTATRPPAASLSTTSPDVTARPTVAETQEQWRAYLTPEITPAYGSYSDRVQEYRVVAAALLRAGLKDDDLIVDVGAGSCDLDHWLRTGVGWRGRYLPIDGAVQGVDLREHRLTIPADWYVSVETLEHLPDAEQTVERMRGLARKGVVVTTPNADTHDVTATDPTHCRPIHPSELEAWGFEVETFTFNPGRGEGDTMLGSWLNT